MRQAVRPAFVHYVVVMVSDGELRGIVRPGAAMRHFRLARYTPEPPLSRFVDRFWRTAWSLDEPFTQRIVTYPVVNLVFQSDATAVVSGIQTRPDDRELSGRGWALGVMFRPAGFGPWSDRPMAELTDRRIDATEFFGPTARELALRLTSLDGHEAGGPNDRGGDPDPLADRRRVAAVADLLTERLADRMGDDVGALPPEGSTVGERLSTLVEEAATATPPVTRVDELAARHGVSARTLQRLFHRHVGVGPKLVLSRYRTQAAAELSLSEGDDLADVALRLGYADQAHLTADLSDQVGVPPGRYRAQEA